MGRDSKSKIHSRKKKCSSRLSQSKKSDNSHGMDSIVGGQTVKFCKFAANVEKNMKLGTKLYLGYRNIFILKGKGLEVKVKVSQVIKVIWQ